MNPMLPLIAESCDEIPRRNEHASMIASGLTQNIDHEHQINLKPWGICVQLLTVESAQIDRLRIKRGGYSSLHEHSDKHNLFIVTEGLLKVTLFERSGDQFEPIGQHLLTPERGVLLVKAQIPHQFLCLEDSQVIEVYWPASSNALDRDDIRRYVENGILNTPGPCAECPEE